MVNVLRTKNIMDECQIGRETLRFYERKGLIFPPKRNESGYREYSREVIAQIQFIRKAQETGFSLKEIKALITLNKSKEIKRDLIESSIEKKMSLVLKKMHSLNEMKKILENLSLQLSDKKAGFIQCPILGKIKLAK